MAGCDRIKSKINIRINIKKIKIKKDKKTEEALKIHNKIVSIIAGKI